MNTALDQGVNSPAGGGLRKTLFIQWFALALVSGLWAMHLTHAAVEPTASEERTASDAEPPEVTHYCYRVLSQHRFDRENFTQGLEFHQGRLYVSSGLYGQSVIRVYDFPEMALINSVPVDPRIFAEGLTIIDSRLILLSW